MQTFKRVVPQQFVDDFETVAERYSLLGLGQYNEAKVAARHDLENAEVCFAAMASYEPDTPKPAARRVFGE